MALTLHGTVSDNTVALDRKTATPLIINGDMQIAQRGTSFSSASTSYHIDRQRLAGSSFGAFTITQDTDVPTGQGFTKSAKYDCTTADASLSASAIMLHQYRFEGQNLQMLKKGTSNAEYLTVAFWVKSNKTGTYIAELFDDDNTRQISQAYTISSANTWEKKVLSFAGDTTGALDNDNARSMTLNLYLAVGTDYSSGTLNTSWASSTNANRAVGQVNLADSTSNDWYITGLQMEVGQFDANSIADFQFEDRGTSLARCQRYYIRENKVSTSQTVSVMFTNSTTLAFGGYYFNTKMRAEPTMGYSALGDFWLTKSGGNVVPIGIIASNSGVRNATLRAQVSSGLTAGQATWFRFDNDSVASPPQYIDFDSEL